MGSVTAISFYVSAAVALAAASFAVSTRVPRRSLAGFALALVALIVPLVQLRAPTVAALVLVCAGLIVALLGGVLRLRPSQTRPLEVIRTAKFWVPASLGLLGFGWSLLAAGSRQVVELPPPIERKAVDFGNGERVLELLTGEHLVASSIVGLLALCCVIAAVLTLVGEGEAEAEADAQTGAQA